MICFQAFKKYSECKIIFRIEDSFNLFNNFRDVSETLFWPRGIFGVHTLVCLLRDSGSRNYRIRLEFGTSAKCLCKISCIFIGEHWPNIACIFSIKYGAYGVKFFKISFDMVIAHKI